MKIKGIFLICMILIFNTIFPIVSSNNKNIEYYYDEEITEEIVSDLPEFFSWKNYNGKDWTTPVKNQYEHGYCGSCWAFAPIATLESVVKIRENYTDFNPDLSEQYVISCLDAGNIKGCGCFGGDPNDVFKYIMETTIEGNNCNGVVLESYFPYSSRLLRYVPSSDILGGWEEYLIPISDWGIKLLNNSIEERKWIKKTIIEKGPVVADIAVPLFLYSSFLPIIDPLHKWGFNNHDPDAYFPSGRPFISLVGHVVSIVGWKDNVSIPNGGYWICKNSWGNNWGYDGFANIEYGSMYIDKSNFFHSSYISWVDYNPDSYKWPHET